MRPGKVASRGTYEERLPLLGFLGFSGRDKGIVNRDAFLRFLGRLSPERQEAIGLGIADGRANNLMFDPPSNLCLLCKTSVFVSTVQAGKQYEGYPLGMGLRA
jgi:hypothetical protein